MSTFDSVISAHDRNVELQIQQRMREAAPEFAARQEAEEKRRQREILRGHIEAFLDTYRGRLRAACNGQATARSQAEATIAEVEQTMRTRFGDLKGEVALLGAAKYVQELEAGIVEVLQNLTAIAAEEQRATVEANRQSRVMGWRADAAKLGARAVAAEIEKNGARLFLKGDAIHIRGGGVPDERIRSYVSVVRADLVGLLRSRDEEFVIED